VGGVAETSHSPATIEVALLLVLVALIALLVLTFL
jgi:hypothetical protein